MSHTLFSWDKPLKRYTKGQIFYIMVSVSWWKRPAIVRLNYKKIFAHNRILKIFEKIYFWMARTRFADFLGEFELKNTIVVNNTITVILGMSCRALIRLFCIFMKIVWFICL